MKTSFLRAGLFATCVAVAGPALADPPPGIDVFVDGTLVGQVTWIVDPLVAGGYTTNQTFFSGTDVRVGEAFFAPLTTPQGTGWTFSYGLGFTFSDAVSRTLTVSYDLPFAGLLTGPVAGVSSVVGTLVDGTGAGAQIGAPASGTVQNVTLLPGSGNNAGLSVGPSFAGAPSGASGSSFQYGEFIATNTLGDALSSWSGMRVVTAFTLQPGNSALAIDGIVNVSPVPEPGALLLGLAGLGLIAARRRLPTA
jgi:MYXO-CTERM domain-containing protein